MTPCPPAAGPPRASTPNCSAPGSPWASRRPRWIWRRKRRPEGRPKTKKPPEGSFLFVIPWDDLRHPGDVWCGREDSNFHALRHSDLNAARLPIPPRPHCVVEASRRSGEESGDVAKDLANHKHLNGDFFARPVESGKRPARKQRKKAHPCL